MVLGPGRSFGAVFFLFLLALSFRCTDFRRTRAALPSCIPLEIKPFGCFLVCVLSLLL